MVRSDQQLVERMALVFHDWFATSNDKVDKPQLMIDQSNLFRGGCFGSFRTLLENVTAGPGDAALARRGRERQEHPNENYAREVLELFTLGADRGAYTENDVRELARCFTGWRYDWDDDARARSTSATTPSRHDNTNKTVFGAHGQLDLAGRLPPLRRERPPRLVLRAKAVELLHPAAAVQRHARARWSRIYTSNSYAIRPVLEAILMHPDFYEGPPMVKPPIVYLASLMRATGTFIHDEQWIWLSQDAGQQLFYPPNVAGWDDNRWLDTNTLRGRWLLRHRACSTTTTSSPGTTTL